jgi:hypothetical protein
MQLKAMALQISLAERLLLLQTTRPEQTQFKRKLLNSVYSIDSNFSEVIFN